jgi:DNA-binding transcriptional LysR family regulator
VRAGMGIGFLSDILAKADPDLVPVLPGLRIPPLPLWLVVHREIRTNQRVRAVFEYLGRGVLL